MKEVDRDEVKRKLRYWRLRASGFLFVLLHPNWWVRAGSGKVDETYKQLVMSMVTTDPDDWIKLPGDEFRTAIIPWKKYYIGELSDLYVSCFWHPSPYSNPEFSFAGGVHLYRITGLRNPGRFGNLILSEYTGERGLDAEVSSFTGLDRVSAFLLFRWYRKIRKREEAIEDEKRRLGHLVMPSIIETKFTVRGLFADRHGDDIDSDVAVNAGSNIRVLSKWKDKGKELAKIIKTCVEKVDQEKLREQELESVMNDNGDKS